MVEEHRAALKANDRFTERRRNQALDWMRELIRTGLEDLFRGDPEVGSRMPAVVEDVRRGRMSSFSAARELLALFHRKE